MILQVLLCLVGSIYSTVWEIYRGSNHWYMDLKVDKNSFIILLGFNFLVWLVALINLIPISLLVTLELVKFF